MQIIMGGKKILVNLSNDDFLVEEGERVSKMVIAKHEKVSWKEVIKQEESESGAGGLGHTGEE